MRFCDDGMQCLTDAVAMFRAVLGEAEDLPAIETVVDAETEIRTRLPYVFGQFSPQARAQMGDYLDHLEELVAFVYRLERKVGLT